MMELFVDIPGYDGAFQVSNLGRVRRADGLLFKPSTPRDRREYPCVSLRHNGRRTRVAVHTLVARAFIGPKPFPSAQVRHFDGDHLNARDSNLLWGTALDNARDRDRHGTTARGPRPNRVGKATGPANGNYRVTPEMKARAVALVRQGHTQRQAAGVVGITQKSVWSALRALATLEAE